MTKFRYTEISNDIKMNVDLKDASRGLNAATRMSLRSKLPRIAPQVAGSCNSELVIALCKRTGHGFVLFCVNQRGSVVIKKENDVSKRRHVEMLFTDISKYSEVTIRNAKVS